MQTRSILFVCLLALFAQHSTPRNLIEELQSKLLLFKSVQESYNTQLQNQTEQNDTLAPDVTNMDNLIKTIKEKQKFEIWGSTGSFYKVQGVDFDDNEEAQSYVVKTVAVKNDKENEDDLKEQQDMLAEMQAMEDLTEADPDFYLFPKFYQSYIATEIFNSSYLEDQNDNYKDLLYFGEDKDVVVIFMEGYEAVTIDGFIAEMAKYQGDVSFLKQLRIMSNLALAVDTISEKYTICNLSSKSIMVNPIEPMEAKQRDDSDLPIEPLELVYNRYFEFKIFDFGSMVKGEPSTRKCQRTVLGMTPPEFFLEGVTHEKHDVYSLAMIALDLNLEEQGLSKLSHLILFGQMAIKMKKKNNIDEYELKEPMLKVIRNQKLYQLAVNFFQNMSSKASLVASIEKFMDGTLKEKILQRHSKSSLNELTLEQIFAKDPEALIPIGYAIVETYNNGVYVQQTLPKKVQELTEIKNNLPTTLEMDPDSEDFKKGKELFRFYTARAGLLTQEGPHVVGYVNKLLSVLSSDAQSRDRVDEFLKYLKDLITQVIEEQGESLKFVSMFGRNYKVVGNKPTCNPGFSLEKQLELQAIGSQETMKFVSDHIRLLI